MKRKTYVALVVLMLLACGYISENSSNDVDYDSIEMESSDTSYSDDFLTDSSIEEDGNSSVQNSNTSTQYSSTYSENIRDYCDVDGCYKEGTNELIGFSGSTEYYCTQHYNEMKDMAINMFGEN